MLSATGSWDERNDDRHLIWCLVTPVSNGVVERVFFICDLCEEQINKQDGSENVWCSYPNTHPPTF